MALPLSIIVLCHNAEKTITPVLEAALRLTPDVHVLENGSTDGSVEKVRATGAVLHQLQWQGYGPTANAGAAFCRHDWVFSIDADEVVSPELATAIRGIDFANPVQVFSIQYLHYFNGTPVRHGPFVMNWITRIYNRTQVRWDDNQIHSLLVYEPPVQLIRLRGLMHHYTTFDWGSYRRKLSRYAQGTAQEYHRRGKRATIVKRHLSGPFNFFQNYVLRGGFLDGAMGLRLSAAHAAYTAEKYAALHRIEQGEKGGMVERRG